MARGPAGPPRLELREGGSPDVAAANHTADVPNAFGQLARVSEALGGELQQMAERAAAQGGAEEAAREIAAGGTPQPTGRLTIRAEAYDQVARRHLTTQRKSAMAEMTAEAFAANGDSPVGLARALDAVRAGMAPTGDAAVDAEVAGAWSLHRADLMARATANARTAFEAQGKANFLQDLQHGSETLDQLASGAALDAGGAGRVAGGVTQLVTSLARYGPREAFEVGGVKFAEDATRLAALSPAEMEPLIQARVAQARKVWILAQAEKVPTETGRRLFAAEVVSRWEQGDAAFAGLDGADMLQLRNQLEAGADRLRTEDRANRAEANQRVRDGIEAFKWGGEVDFDALAADAAASGDPGLQAQVQFYRSADPETRGVLSTVYARSLGLIGGDGAGGAVIVDAAGNPVAGGAATWDAGQALAGEIRKDPAAYFSGLLGAKATVFGKRDPAKNAKVGGAKDSAHLSDLGWDISVPGMSSAEVFAKLSAAGVPYDQLLEEGDHVHFGLGPKMRGERLVKGANGAWSVPAAVKPGTPAYAAWAATKEGFSSDPLNFVRGGKNRPALAAVPVLVPDAWTGEPSAQQAWAASLAKRHQLGQVISRSYGVPARMLTNQERDYYKSQIEADPQKGIGLAMAARAAAGPAAALAMLRELGEGPLEASTHLHIADLAVYSPTFAKAAAQGLAIRTEGAKLPEDKLREIREQFDSQRAAIPPEVMQAAMSTAIAAATHDYAAGGEKPASYYLRSALGATQAGGKVYGGPATLNGAPTVLPRWLAADRADEALEALGALWAQRGVGPVWSNGEAVTARQLAGMRLTIAPTGRYRFVNPKTGNALRGRDGKVFEADLDKARAYVAQRLGPSAARGDD